MTSGTGPWATWRPAAGGVSVAVVAVVLGALAPSAAAAPPHGEGGHMHHVDIGNGECVDVNAVAFLAEERGLHRGANASGSDRGIWHGSCS